jgi:hypothetical protein
MIDVVYELPFLLVHRPNLKIKKPVWLQRPSAMFVFSAVMLSYFLVCGGEWLPVCVVVVCGS